MVKISHCEDNNYRSNLELILETYVTMTHNLFVVK